LLLCTVRARATASSTTCPTAMTCVKHRRFGGSRSRKAHPLRGDPISCIRPQCSHMRCSVRHRSRKRAHVRHPWVWPGVRAAIRPRAPSPLASDQPTRRIGASLRGMGAGTALGSSTIISATACAAADARARPVGQVALAVPAPERTGPRQGSLGQRRTSKSLRSRLSSRATRARSLIKSFLRASAPR